MTATPATQPTVTFLVPCYNVSHCVSRCIDSILSCAEIHDDIELLVVNDGSTDDTLRILHDYACHYPTVVRVIDKVNGGWGSVVNLGIREAHGRYLRIVDADDWVNSSKIQEYVTQLTQLHCDFIATEYTDYYQSTDSYTPHTFMPPCYNDCCSLVTFWRRYPSAWSFPIHAVTYRTQFLQQLNLTVGERYYADIEYILYPIPKIDTLCVLPINLLVYFHGSDEQSTSASGYARHYLDYLSMTQRLINFYYQLPSDTVPAVRSCLVTNIMGTINFAYNLLLSPHYAGRIKEVRRKRRHYDQWLKTQAPTFYHHAGLTKRRGIAYIKLWRLTGINLLSLT